MQPGCILGLHRTYKVETVQQETVIQDAAREGRIHEATASILRPDFEHLDPMKLPKLGHNSWQADECAAVATEVVIWASAPHQNVQRFEPRAVQKRPRLTSPLLNRFCYNCM